MEKNLISRLMVSVLPEHIKLVERKLTLSFVIIVLLCSSVSAQDTNRALNHDGVNDYVNMNNILNNLPLPFTTEAWVYWRGPTTTSHAEYGIITSDNDPDFYYRGFAVRVLNSGSITMRLGNGGIAAGFSRRDKYSPDNALPLNTWTHIAVVVRGLTNMSIYVNGVDVGGSYAGTGGNMQSSGHPFVIGRHTYQQSSGQDWFFNGIIDEVRIWRRERTQAQIISKMNQTLCQEYYSTLDSGLVGYWQLDSIENSGMVRDLSFNQGHGYIVNGPFIAPGALISNCNPNLPVTLDLKVIIEGFYNPGLNRMSRKDTVTVYLRSATPPYPIVDTAQSKIDSLTFSGLFNFNNSPPGNYYLVAKHFNSIETWSREGRVPISGSNISYNFTDSLSKAYGNNMIVVDNSPAAFGMYSGDVDQNCAIELNDIILISNDAIFFREGYVATDLNGDYIVNLSDVLIAFNNTNKFVSAVRP